MHGKTTKQRRAAQRRRLAEAKILDAKVEGLMRKIAKQIRAERETMAHFVYGGSHGAPNRVSNPLRVKYPN